MSDKKYYWLKLKTDFFNSDVFDYLMSQDNGSDYVIIYQMLCAMAINSDGELINKLGSVCIPVNSEKICRYCRYFKIETIEKAMELFTSVKLLYVNENGNLQITDFNKLVGCETKWAEYKRQKRSSETLDNVQKISSTMSSKILDIRDKSIEYRDKSINRDMQKVKKPDKHKYGEYKNVLLSDEEIQKLEKEFPHNYKEYIERLSSYMASTGKSYKSHYATIRVWERKAKENSTKGDVSNGTVDKSDSERFFKSLPGADFV